MQLREIRNHQAAYMFMEQFIKVFEESTILTTDKAPAKLYAPKKLKKSCFFMCIQNRTPLSI
ncbi:hypothetical protein II5_05845 [Bacillus cereus MSX-A1]|nr:hypothetical protein II5_05845 [Bacillus cereus MSX-A1]